MLLGSFHKVLVLFVLMNFLSPNILLSQKWTALPEPLNWFGNGKPNEIVTKLMVDSTGDNLIIGGTFNEDFGMSDDTLSNIVLWDGGNLYSIKGGLFGLGINDMVYYKNGLVACGNAGIAPQTVLLIGYQIQNFPWIRIPFQCPFYDGTGIKQIHVYKEKLYAGIENAILDTVTLPLTAPQSTFASYSDSCWEFPGGGIYGGMPEAMIEYQSMLILGGNFDSVGSPDLNNVLHTKYVAGWDGTNWIDISINDPPEPIQSLCVHNDTLYASDYDGNIIFLDGNEWKQFAKLHSNDHQLGLVGLAFFMKSVDNKLYIGGYFQSIDSTLFTQNIAYYANNSWKSMGDGIPAKLLNDLIKWKDEIYVCGNFDTKLNGKRARFIAKWDETIGISERITHKNQVDIFPNPVENTLNVCLRDELNSSAKISIFSIEGSRKCTFQLESRISKLDISNLPSGLYIYKIERIFEQTDVSIGKFIKK